LKFLRLELERADQEAQDQDEALTRVLAEAESLTADAAPVGPEAADGTMESSDGVDAVGSGIVGDEELDDEELIAYNRALAALADKDRRAR